MLPGNSDLHFITNKQTKMCMQPSVGLGTPVNQGTTARARQLGSPAQVSKKYHPQKGSFHTQPGSARKLEAGKGPAEVQEHLGSVPSSASWFSMGPQFPLL